MNKFYIKKDAFPTYVALFMLIIFIIFSFIRKDIITVSITICLFVIYVLTFAQREILIEFCDNKLKIQKYSSKLLPNEEIIIPIENIERIKQFSTRFNAFHVIKLKTGKTINLPWQRNSDLDKFIIELDNILSEKYLEYKKIRKKKINPRTFTDICSYFL